MEEKRKKQTFEEFGVTLLCQRGRRNAKFNSCGMAEKLMCNEDNIVLLSLANHDISSEKVIPNGIVDWSG